jgi:hypothetical protein
VKCVSFFVVGPSGIYYGACSDVSLFLQDPATGREQFLGKLEGRSGARNFAVSPDARSFLYSRQVGGGDDLMMIENFR